MIKTLGFLLSPRSIHFYPRYLVERAKFLRLGGQITASWPFLSDYGKPAGTIGGHYFHQDLYVAQAIAGAKPHGHTDIGSSISGFVAHVASFMPVEVLDIRPLKSGCKNISFTQCDVMQEIPYKCISLSCLNVIEHFGLGRYGDPINPEGHLVGFKNMVNCLYPGGVLYISFPIAKENRLEFNAQRVFHPQTIFSWPGADELELKDFAFVDDGGDLHPSASIGDALEANLTYGCGIYTFVKRP